MSLANKKIDNIVIENATLIFRNFSGKESKFNPKGNRNFCVILSEDTAKVLERDGWNVRTLAPRDEDEEPVHYLQVACSYTHIKPNVWLVASGNKTLLDEELIDSLDYAEIKTVDLVIRPYVWSVGDKEGIKAYVKTMYVVIEEDPLGRKYDEISEEDYPF